MCFLGMSQFSQQRAREHRNRSKIDGLGNAGERTVRRSAKITTKRSLLNVALLKEYI